MQHAPRRTLARVGIAAVLLVVCAGAFAAKKTDVIEFGDGSRLVGEFKGLDRGKASFKTDATDTITIDWADVTRLITKKEIRVDLRDGRRYFGALGKSTQDGSLSINTGVGAIALPVDEAVALEPVDSTILDRIDFDISLGYSFAKSTGVEELNFASTLRYDTELVSRDLSLSSQTTSSDSEPDSTRNVAGYRSISMRDNRWFAGWRGQFESNDELSLDRRIVGGAIGGRTFFPSANQRLRAFGGLAVNSEKFEGNDSQSSIEAIVAGTIDWFDFGEPELDLSSSLTLYPSITETGRVRSNFNTTLRWELIKDLFWDVSLFDDYDSRPQGKSGDPNPENNDYGVTTSVGWSW